MNTFDEMLDCINNRKSHHFIEMELRATNDEKIRSTKRVEFHIDLKFLIEQDWSYSPRAMTF